MNYLDAIESVKNHDFTVMRSITWERNNFMYYVNSSSVTVDKMRGSARKAFQDVYEKEKIRIKGRFDKREGRHIIVNYIPTIEEMDNDWEVIILEDVSRSSNSDSMDDLEELMIKMESVESSIKRMERLIHDDDYFYRGRFSGSNMITREHLAKELRLMICRAIKRLDDKTINSTSYKQLLPLALLDTLMEYFMVYGKGANPKTNTFMQLISDISKYIDILESNDEDEITTSVVTKLNKKYIEYKNKE